MACVENIPTAQANAESEMEEGEIIDDLDDVSDISSEEEFLLRQRLQVLENYNNVLERKKAKRTSVLPGIHHKKDDKLLPDLSEISATEFEDGHTHVTYTNIRVHRLKSHPKTKRKKELLQRNKDHKKKVHRNKKRLELKVISETSEESEDEYRNKRRKLANAVVVNKVDKNDKSSLSARLKKMLCSSEPQVPDDPIIIESKQTDYENKSKDEVALSPISSINADDPIFNPEIQDNVLTQNVAEDPAKVSELIDLCTDDDVNVIDISDRPEVINSVVDETNEQKNKESDDDIELLRQHALKTKSAKTKPVQHTRHEDENKILSEDEDSDTTELRLICLKSALLKKAIEMKQKQKLRKRLSSVSVQANLAESLLNDQEMFSNKVDNTDNNTDIESVDMDIGSDVDEKTKNCSDDGLRGNNIENNAILENNENIVKNIPKIIVPKVDELEEDEDLLRAKLLTSLSNNLSNLVKPNILKNLDDARRIKKDIPQISVQKTIVQNNNMPQEKLQVNNVPQRNVQVKKVPQEKPFIIHLGESDSEDEHEATKNLTKMHMKLSEQPDFQLKLDMFLKSTRMQVEKSTLPDVVQEPTVPKKAEKYVAKTVNHLPKSEQIEYKNLVRRMAELEKIKQSRQIPMPMENKSTVMGKETLKPRNMFIDSSKLIPINNVEERIALSRKKIAEESSKILRLKEEATKLSQKYKIVATELRNISTAISLNKKQQKAVHTCLSKIRLQHQKLLKSSTTTPHSKVSNIVPFVHPLNNRVITASKTQKENEPLKEDYKNTAMLKTVKVSVSNDFKDETVAPNTRLSVQVDVMSNRKVVQTLKSPVRDQFVDSNAMDYNDNDCRTDIEAAQKSYVENQRDAISPVVEKGGGKRRTSRDMLAICNREEILKGMDVNDYKSPLQALDATNWEADPNAILCPFDVGGECKDPDCKYLHTLISTQ